MMEEWNAIVMSLGRLEGMESSEQAQELNLERAEDNLPEQLVEDENIWL